MKQAVISKILLPAFVFAFVGVTLISSVLAAAVPRLDKEVLRKMLGGPDVIILDVRNSKNWQESEFKIKGAIRKRPKLFADWAKEFPSNKVLVLY